MVRKRAFITGVTGQDGSYLAELLLGKGYEVHGLIRRSSMQNTGRIASVLSDLHADDTRLFLHYGDLSDAANLMALVHKVAPDEVYHLAAQSHVRVSFDIPEYTCDVTGIGTLRLLEAIRRIAPRVRFYQAGSSEMFGNPPVPPPFSEQTSFHPQSPYACAKVLAHELVRQYREAYGLFAVNGILFNHESPRRGETFVTRKITLAVARIVAGHDEKLYLGNLDAKRDWGYAPDYVEAMWRMLQQDVPDDYVVATGEAYSVREFLDCAFARAGIGDWQRYVAIDPYYFRPSEVHVLIGDATRARERLGWRPSMGFQELVHCMVDADMKHLEDQRHGRVAYAHHDPRAIATPATERNPIAA